MFYHHLGGANDFGDLTAARRTGTDLSNDTVRGFGWNWWFTIYVWNSTIEVIVTMATTGDASILVI